MKLFCRFAILALGVAALTEGCMSYEKKAERFAQNLASNQFFICADIDENAERYNVYYSQRGSDSRDSYTGSEFWVCDLKTKKTKKLCSLDLDTQTWLFNLTSKGRHQIVFLDKSQFIYSLDLRTLSRKTLVDASAGEDLEGIFDTTVFLYSKDGLLYRYDAVKETSEQIHFGDESDTALKKEAKHFPDTERLEISVYRIDDNSCFVCLISPMYMRVSYSQVYLLRPAESCIATYLDSGANPCFNEQEGSVKIRVTDYVRTYGSAGVIIKENPTAAKFLQMKSIPQSNIIAINGWSNMACYFMVGGGWNNGDFYFYDGESEHKINSYENELGEKNHFSLSVKSKSDISVVESEYGDFGPVEIIFIGNDFTYEYLLKFDMLEGKSSLIDLGSSVTKRSNYFKIKDGSEIRYYDLAGNRISSPESNGNFVDDFIGLFDLFL